MRSRRCLVEEEAGRRQGGDLDDGVVEGVKEMGGDDDERFKNLVRGEKGIRLESERVASGLAAVDNAVEADALN